MYLLTTSTFVQKLKSKINIKSKLLFLVARGDCLFTFQLNQSSKLPNYESLNHKKRNELTNSKKFLECMGYVKTQTILSTNKCLRPCSSGQSPLVPGYEIRVVLLLSSFVINQEISIQQFNSLNDSMGAQAKSLDQSQSWKGI